MAVNKLVDGAQLDANLLSIANSIRGKIDSEDSLAFPNGFLSAVNSIPNVFNKSVYLYENTNNIEFETDFEPKFIFLSSYYNWTSVKRHLDDVAGKEVRAIYYYMFCRNGFFFDYTENIRITIAFQKSDDGIFQPSTYSHVTEESETGKYKTTISRQDTAVAAWRFSGSEESPMIYNIVAMG